MIVFPRWIQSEMPINKVKFEIFDSHPTNFEMKVFNSLQSTQNFFAEDDVRKYVDIGATVLKFIPFIGEMDEVLQTVTGLLEDESDWKADFSKVIAGEALRSIADNQIFWMQSQIKTIRKNIPLLDKKKQPNRQNRMANAQYIHNSLDTMVNYLGNKIGVFRKFPLVTAPLVISLSLLIATFLPIANATIPIETEHLQLACKTRNILKKYRSRAFIARANKLNAIYDHYDVMLEVFAKPYSSRGYNEADQDVLHCNTGCSLPEPKQNFHCLLDAFATIKYNYGGVSSEASVRNRCIKEYTAVVRHRVEQMFPVNIFNKLCGVSQREEKSKRKPTGKIHNSFNFKSIKIK